MLLSSMSNPSLSDCSVPAKALVDTYPFLADASDNGKEPYVRVRYGVLMIICMLLSVHSIHGPSLLAKDVLMLTEEIMMVKLQSQKGEKCPGKLLENISIWKALRKSW